MNNNMIKLVNGNANVEENEMDVNVLAQMIRSFTDVGAKSAAETIKMYIENGGTKEGAIGLCDMIIADAEKQTS